MLSFKKTLTVAAGVASAFAFGASHASADTTDSQNLPTDYVVKSGDTLNKLSSEFNTTVDSIAAKNNIANVNLIMVGQHLNFAETVAQSAAPAQAAQTPAETHWVCPATPGAATWFAPCPPDASSRPLPPRACGKTTLVPPPGVTPPPHLAP